MDRKVAITGGAGFIGSNLAEALAVENEIIIIDDLSSGNLRTKAGTVVWIFWRDFQVHSALARGEQPVIYGDGEHTRGFVYVKDVVRANILASRSGCGIFNIAGGKRTSLNELAILIGKILERDVETGHRDSRSGDIRKSLADISRARNIGYNPQTCLEDGLAETIQWFSR